MLLGSLKRHLAMIFGGDWRRGTPVHDAFDRASCWATLGPLLAQVEWLKGYDLRQSTRPKLIPSCPAGRVICLGNFGLSAPDYFCPVIIAQKLEATDPRWFWMECSFYYIFCQLRLIHSS